MPVRKRRRYLLLGLEGNAPAEAGDLVGLILSAVVEFFGEDRAVGAGLKLIEYDRDRRLAVLRCSHDCLRFVRAAIASITEWGGHPLAVHVLDVSGTLRALRRRLPSRAKGLSKGLRQGGRG